MFSIYVKIQPACKKVAGKYCLEKVSNDPVNTLGTKSIFEVVRSLTFPEINAFLHFSKIQDGHQKRWENNF